MVANQIQCLQSRQFAGLFELIQSRFQMRQINAIGLHADAAPVNVVALHDSEIHEVRGIFDQYKIAGIKENFGQNIQELLRSMGDEQALWSVGRGLGGSVIQMCETGGG